jgi:hypothetical protein
MEDFLIPLFLVCATALFAARTKTRAMSGGYYAQYSEEADGPNCQKRHEEQYLRCMLGDDDFEYFFEYYDKLFAAYDAEDARGRWALHHLCKTGGSDYDAFFNDKYEAVNRAVDFNLKDAHGNTALHVLATSDPLNWDTLTIIKELRRKGADPTIENINGHTARFLYRMYYEKQVSTNGSQIDLSRATWAALSPIQNHRRQNRNQSQNRRQNRRQNKSQNRSQNRSHLVAAGDGSPRCSNLRGFFESAARIGMGSAYNMTSSRGFRA